MATLVNVTISEGVGLTGATGATGSDASVTNANVVAAMNMGDIPAQFAQNSLRMATIPSADDAVTVAGRTYVFKASASGANEVTIGASRTTAATALAAAINSGSGGSSAHATITAYADKSQVGFRAKTAGSAANAYTLTSTSANVVAERKNFKLGRDAGGASLGELAGTPRSYDNPLDLPTPDGMPSVTHPGVVHIDGGFAGFEYWMAMTPWPSGVRERPNILCSHNRKDWFVPNGLTNPIVSDAFMTAEGEGFTFMADTALCLLHDGTLACFYIMVAGSDAATYRQTSSDGVTWSTPVRVIDTNASGDHDAAARRGSMAVIAEPDGTYSMFSCGGTDTPGSFHRWTSPDTTTWTWQGACTVEGANAQQIWHADTVKVGDTYHVLFMSSDTDSTGRLYHFTSTDGDNFFGSWEAPSVPISGEPWDALSNYRSAIVPRFGDSGLAWDIYVSGRPISALSEAGDSGGPPWRIGLFESVKLATRDKLDATFGQATDLALRVTKLPLDSTSWATFVSGTGAHTANACGGILQTTGATASSWAFAKLADQTPFFPWYDHTEGLSTAIDWDQPFILDVPVFVVTTGSTARFRCYLGMANTSVDSPTAFANKGVGFLIENLALKAVTHDGSTETVGSSIKTLTASRPVRIRIRNNGNGTYGYYVNGTLLATVDGPSGNGTGFFGNLNLAAENQGTATTYLWVVGQISYANLSNLP